MRTAPFKAYFLILFAVVLQACAGKRGLELPEFPDWETRRSVLEDLERWEFSGRIGVSAGDEGFNGKIRWTIPVTSLQFWALGIPDPSMPGITRMGDDGMPSEIEQGAWQVTIEQYRESGGQPMPRKIVAVNADAKVRLVIDKWSFLKM
jgi:outer membrane lipoprotein LolB